MFLYTEKKLMIIAKIDPRTFPKTNNNFVFLQYNNDDAEKLPVKYVIFKGTSYRYFYFTHNVCASC